MKGEKALGSGITAKPYLLAIDNGTQSVKALLFDAEGLLVCKSMVPFKPYHSSRPGWVEQSPEYFWNCLCRACRALWVQSKILPKEVAGVGVTTQRGTMINLDRNGNPLRPAFVWLDERRSTSLPPLGPFWNGLFRMLGLTHTIRGFQTKAPDNWIAENQPDIWAKTYKYLLLSGYLHHKLTGLYRDSVGNQVGYLPFDFKRLDWASTGSWRWKALRVHKEMLPELVSPGEVLGEVSSEAAAETGLSAGTPVIAAAADKACEVLGAGCSGPEEACLGYGTTATINVPSAKYVESYPFVPPYPSAVPGMYNVEFQNFRGYWLVSWFRKEFGHLEEQMAVEQGLPPERLLDRMLDQAPPGSMGLVVQPYWTSGVRIPGPEAKGAIIGFGDVHSRAHVYRAILEGLSYALREGKERIERRTKIPVKRLMVAGGGAQSDQVMQMTADIFGVPAVRPEIFETSGLGAAVDVATGLGIFPDFRAAVRAMSRTGSTFEPDLKKSAQYTALYLKVFKRMYRKLKPLYESIQQITGYPN